MSSKFGCALSRLSLLSKIEEMRLEITREVDPRESWAMVWCDMEIDASGLLFLKSKKTLLEKMSQECDDYARVVS